MLRGTSKDIWFRSLFMLLTYSPRKWKMKGRLFMTVTWLMHDQRDMRRCRCLIELSDTNIVYFSLCNTAGEKKRDCSNRPNDSDPFVVNVTFQSVTQWEVCKTCKTPVLCEWCSTSFTKHRRQNSNQNRRQMAVDNFLLYSTANLQRDFVLSTSSLHRLLLNRTVNIAFSHGQVM